MLEKFVYMNYSGFTCIVWRNPLPFANEALHSMSIRKNNGTFIPSRECTCLKTEAFDTLIQKNK